MPNTVEKRALLVTLPLESLREFDIDAGLVYADGDQELYLEVLAMFHEQLTTEFAGLPQRLRTDITTDLARQAHTLKGSASSVGATHIAAAAQVIDQQIKEGKTSLEVELLDRLHASIQSALHELNSVL